jgi:hypothetical protein
MIKIIAFLFINMWAMNYAIGASGYKYWGSTARDAKQNAQLYFYK